MRLGFAAVMFVYTFFPLVNCFAPKSFGMWSVWFFQISSRDIFLMLERLVILDDLEPISCSMLHMQVFLAVVFYIRSLSLIKEPQTSSVVHFVPVIICSIQNLDYYAFATLLSLCSLNMYVQHSMSFVRCMNLQGIPLRCFTRSFCILAV